MRWGEAISVSGPSRLAGRLGAVKNGWNRRVLFVLASVPLAAVLVLLAVTLWVSLLDDPNAGLKSGLSLRHFVALYGDPFVASALLNTLGFAATAVSVAMVLGVAAAWLVESTDLPLKRLAYLLMTIGLLVPTFFQAMGWVFFLHPRIGMLNRWLMALFGLDSAPINIANVVGMGWVEGLGLASLAFIMTSPILRMLNPALEEAALVHGLGRWWTLGHVVAPLLQPALLAAAIYIGVIALATFDVPAVIGLGNKIFTFSTLIYVRVTPETGLPDYGVVGALSAALVVVSLFLSCWYFRVIRLAHRYQVVEGRNYRPMRTSLGGKRWLAWVGLGGYFILAQGMPLLMVIWAALLPYFQPLSIAALSHVTLKNFASVDWSLLLRGAINTLTLMVTVPTFAVLFGLAISWVVVRSRARVRFAFDLVAFLPHAIPNLVFALALVVFALFVVPRGVPFYGTVGIIAAAYVLVRISLTTRVFNGALLQIHRELEDVAYICGMRTLQTLWKVILPLLVPAILNLWVWCALLSYRELTMAAFMVSQHNLTVPVIIWGFWNTGHSGQAAAASLIFMAALAPFIALYWGLRSRANLESLDA
ncbi:MAG TPA: ABC transporter permease subunit [Stellaceae bacterium]|nr:ABC transporter permease subunit [Stellaceae bacterium]